MQMFKAFCLALLFVAFCRAQKESITIGPGDLVHVKVLEAAELEQSVRVTDAGAVPLIVGGNVKIAGFTPAEAANEIQRALVEGHYLLTPHVSVTIEQPATENVTVVGQVRAPGSYPIGTPRSILDVLALSGGITDLANREITIERRETKERLRYNLSNHSDKALDENIQIYPGDTILVPKVDLIYALGDLRKPGGFPMSTNDSKLSVLQAIAFAGGTPPTAVPSDARLVRRQADGTYIEIPLPLSDMQKGKKADMPLQADDIIYVPFSYLRNAMLGITNIVAAASSAAIYQF
ncbi:polysaccharide biosynthesis/export family protein [Acidobacterium sp. S8]|uniref:polysaccharide biosynthesis/export family protein n=1 Tax=Acidobacterium sp. S8 TaxID=1641854 RepID=UPI00131A8BEE|nr:polysaccharide biosynthesis/export family protein [Acidobacterium sp. S8]